MINLGIARAILTLVPGITTTFAPSLSESVFSADEASPYELDDES